MQGRKSTIEMHFLALNGQAEIVFVNLQARVKMAPIGALNINQKGAVAVFGQKIAHHLSAFQADNAFGCVAACKNCYIFHGAKIKGVGEFGFIC